MLKKLLILPLVAAFAATPVSAQEQEPITMPDGIEPIEYVDQQGNSVYVAVDGKDIYIQGLTQSVPSFTVKGSLNGTQALFPQRQYVGDYIGYPFYTIFWQMDYNEDDVLEFYPAPEGYEYPLSVDLENGVIQSPQGMDQYTLFGFATYMNDDWQWLPDYRQNIYLKKFIDYTGTPVNPTNLEVEKFEGDEFYSFMFTLPLQTTSGNALSLYDTYYVIYVNGEVYEFVPDEEKDIYAGLPYAVSEMPVYFSNDYDIITNGEGHLVGLYVDNIESVGVQTVYLYEGESTKSEIVTMEYSGVGSIVAEEEYAEYYDLAGRRIMNPDKGIYIKRSHLTDGKTVTTKIVK